MAGRANASQQLPSPLGSRLRLRPQRCINSRPRWLFQEITDSAHFRPFHHTHGSPRPPRTHDPGRPAGVLPYNPRKFSLVSPMVWSWEVARGCL